MIGDPLKPVATGQTIQPSAATWNAFVAAASKAQKQRLEKSLPTIGANRQTLAYIQNTTEADISPFGFLSITGSLIDPTSDLTSFQTFIGLKGGAVDVTKQLVIVLETIPANTGVGVCVVAGAVQCYVKMITANDGYADLVGTEMHSGIIGRHKILWAPSGATGWQWCIISLNCGSPVQFAKPTGAYTSGNTFTFNPCLQGGSNLDNTTTLTLYLTMPVNNSPQGLTLDATQVYPFVPFYDVSNTRNSGLVLGLGSSGLPNNKDAKKYQVLQLSGDGNGSTNDPSLVIWDYVRLRGNIA
jgi:hypothetical protein